jgi:hypothetical protein
MPLARAQTLSYRFSTRRAKPLRSAAQGDQPVALAPRSLEEAHMRRIIIGSAILAAALFGAPALAQSAALGDWATVIETPQGTFNVGMSISEADGGYAVAFDETPPPGTPADAPPMESTVSDVVVDGNAFSFKRMLTTPQGPIELTYEGMVDGDSLTGTATSSFGAVPIAGTRK